MRTVWHVSLAQNQTLQFTNDQLAGAIRSGSITAKTLVWQRGMSEWSRARQVPTLAAHFSELEGEPPPLPPRALAEQKQATARSVERPTMSGFQTRLPTVGGQTGSPSTSSSRAVAARPTPKSAEILWHIHDSRGEHTLLSTESLVLGVRDRSIKASVLVWREGLTDWTKAFEVPELGAQFSPPGVASAIRFSAVAAHPTSVSGAPDESGEPAAEERTLTRAPALRALPISACDGVTQAYAAGAEAAGNARGVVEGERRDKLAHATLMAWVQKHLVVAATAAGALAVIAVVAARLGHRSHAQLAGGPDQRPIVERRIDGEKHPKQPEQPVVEVDGGGKSIVLDVPPGTGKPEFQLLYFVCGAGALVVCVCLSVLVRRAIQRAAARSAERDRVAEANRRSEARRQLLAVAEEKLRKAGASKARAAELLAAVADAGWDQCVVTGVVAGRLSIEQAHIASRWTLRAQFPSLDAIRDQKTINKLSAPVKWGHTNSPEARVAAESFLNDLNNMTLALSGLQGHNPSDSHLALIKAVSRGAVDWADGVRLARGEVVAGMPTDCAVLAWGEPHACKATMTKSGEKTELTWYELRVGRRCVARKIAARKGLILSVEAAS